MKIVPTKLYIHVIIILNQCVFVDFPPCFCGSAKFKRSFAWNRSSHGIPRRVAFDMKLIKNNHAYWWRRGERVPLTAAASASNSPRPHPPVFIHRCEQQQWFNNQREASLRVALCALIDVVKEMFSIVRRTKKILLPSFAARSRFSWGRVNKAAELIKCTHKKCGLLCVGFARRKGGRGLVGARNSSHFQQLISKQAAHLTHCVCIKLKRKIA